MVTQWLLIGGPAHGRVLGIKGGSQVRFPHSDGEDYLYVGQTYLRDGVPYRIGVCHSECSNPERQYDIRRLIHDAKLEPLAAVQ